MTWLVLMDVTQKIHSVSEIRSVLDPIQQNLSLDPMLTTNFEMFDNNSPVPEASSVDRKDAVFGP